MIAFDGAGKTYTNLLTRKRVDALAGFTMEMKRGEVVGIAGPNGAGKSTLISLVMGFLNPSSGSVRIDGSAPRPWVEAHGVGYLTELVNLPPQVEGAGGTRPDGQPCRCSRCVHAGLVLTSS